MDASPLDDILAALPARRGHFRLESGLHTDLWLTLDALFISSLKLAPSIATLADRLRPYNPSAVCGPLMGGAFLAQSLAARLGVNFYFSENRTTSRSAGLFSASYDLPLELRRKVKGERVALVDDVISAGSSVRATATALENAEASIVVVGAFLVLGNIGLANLASRGLVVEALGHRDLALWAPEVCPKCGAGEPLTDPLGG